MHKVLGVLASLAALFGAFLLAMMFFAVGGSSGTAIVALQLYAMIFAGTAILLGVLGLILGRPAASRFCSFGVGLGVTTVLALAVIYLIY